MNFNLYKTVIALRFLDSRYCITYFILSDKYYNYDRVELLQNRSCFTNNNRRWIQIRKRSISYSVSRRNFYFFALNMYTYIYYVLPRTIP